MTVNEIEKLVEITVNAILNEGAPGEAGLSEKLKSVIRKNITVACLEVHRRDFRAQQNALIRFLRETEETAQ